jgi:hypothetical protein
MDSRLGGVEPNALTERRPLMMTSSAALCSGEMFSNTLFSFHLFSFNVALGVEALSLSLPIFYESFLLTPGFFPWKRRNICTATPWISDWNIQIL